MGTQSISVLALTVKLAAAVGGGRFVTAAGGLPAAGGNTLGVARAGGDAGDLTAVDVLGTAIVAAGGAVAAGDTLSSDAAGRAVAATDGAKVALALEAAAAGQLFEVLLVQNVA